MSDDQEFVSKSEPTSFQLQVETDVEDPVVRELIVNGQELEVKVDAGDVVAGLNNNDGSIFAFIMDMLDRAGSVELEQDILEELEERLGRAR